MKCEITTSENKKSGTCPAFFVGIRAGSIGGNVSVEVSETQAVVVTEREIVKTSLREVVDFKEVVEHGYLTAVV